MKVSRLTLFAILLWCVTAGVFAWFFISGKTAPSTDGRTAILLQAAERDLVLTEMRGLLGAVQGVLDGINANDPRKIAQAAGAVGMAAAVDVNPVMMAKLPLPFKSMGMSVHQDMDAIAAEAQAGKSAQEISAMLASTLNKCVACHAAWRLQAE